MSAARSERAGRGRRLRERLLEVLGADLRSLALFRIVLGLLVLGDLLLRAADLVAHYTDAGVLPRAALLGEGVLDTYDFSLNLINGQLVFQLIVFALGIVAAFSMVFGYRTRVATVVALVVLLSLQNRNPFVLNAGDTLLRVLVFWSIFLPLGALWSVDRRRERPAPRLDYRFLSIASLALFLQICFLYVFTAILKSGDEWRTDGTALYYALNMGQIATPLGTWLSRFPDLLQFLTFGTLALEAFGPILLFSPILTGPVRTAVVAAFMSLHLGIWMTMEIGIFPFVSSLCMVCFLPAWFWDRALPWARAALSNLSGGKTGAGGGEKSWPRWASLGGVLGLFGSRGPDAGAASGDGDAGGRHAGGPRERLRSSLETNILAGLFLVYVLAWNVMTVSDDFRVPVSLQPVGTTLGISQYWNMFAPYPGKSTTWHVIPAELSGGQRVDIMPVTRDDFGLYEVSFATPPRAADVYETNHWRKYMQAISDEDNVDQRLYFGRYLCDAWNARHGEDERLETFEIYEMRQATNLDGSTSEPERDMLWRHNCS